ncbi:MAG: VOC family protein [Henriciella sp.]|uniref:VOC family protein n=1 Tax=Henriciella sp. TaxID=1968823 RepID=UPI003C73A0F5
MLTHVHLGSNDVERSRKFYDALFEALGGAQSWKDPERDRWFWVKDGQFLVVGEPLDKGGTTPSNGLTIGFAIDSAEQGAAWHAAGLANGGTDCEGVSPPGERDSPGGKVYLAYLRDPDGHKLCVFKRL